MHKVTTLLRCIYCPLYSAVLISMWIYDTIYSIVSTIPPMSRQIFGTTLVESISGEGLRRLNFFHNNRFDDLLHRTGISCVKTGASGDR